MKQTILAVTAAALIFLSACNATTLPADVPVESAKPETSAADPQSTPDEVVTLPADEHEATPGLTSRRPSSMTLRKL